MDGFESYIEKLFSDARSNWPSRTSDASGDGPSRDWRSGFSWPGRTSSGSSSSGSTTYSASNPPPGFTSKQWSTLLSLSRRNPKLADLIKQYTAAAGTPGTTPASQAWRRENPTNTSQLLRQLSFNAGEMGMPGGYVGAIQTPAYGTGLPPKMLTDTKNYGREPGYGEANFFQQSMKGGMAPIAAMSPLGVPEGWNPGGTSSGDIKSQLEKYLSGSGRFGDLSSLFNLFGGSGFGGGGGDRVYWTSELTGRQMSGYPYKTGGVRRSSGSRPDNPTPDPTPTTPPALDQFPITGGDPILPPYGTTT